MRKILMMLFVSAVSLLANGQVVKSINDGNMKIPRNPVKPTLKAKPVATPKEDVVIDTNTVYFRMIDSAQVCVKNNQLDRAEQFLLNAIKQEPQNPSNSLVLSNLATLQREQGKLLSAEKNYTMALALTPNAVTLLMNRAALYTEMDSLNLAIADYRRVLAIDETDIPSRFSLGLIALGMKDYKQAEEYFNEMLRYSPNSGLAREGQGLLYKATGKYSQAAKSFTDVIKAKPTVDLLANRADCYLMTNQLSEASVDISDAIKLEPNNGRLYILKAKLDKMRFDFDQEKKDIDLAVKHGISRKEAEALLK
jgi:tetratricopeptide (TPR) repeat protein